MNERQIQVLLMEEMLGRRHQVAVPNVRDLLLSSADLLTVTGAGFVNEFEIKCTRSDYTAEFREPTRWKHSWRKTNKHRALKGAYDNEKPFRGYHKMPNYFWFVTIFDIQPPEYAGWIEVVETTGRKPYRLVEHKRAPRLHTNKWDAEQVARVARLLSYRVMNHYKRGKND